MRTLITVYSRTGATRMAAEQLAQQLGADVEVISALRSISFLGGVLQSLTRAAPEIGPTRDPSAYDQVIVAGPVWAGRMATPLRTYLLRHSGRFRALSAFCTSGSGQPYGAVFDEIGRIAGRALDARLSISEAQARKGPSAGLAPFVAKLRPAEVRP